MLQWLPDDFRPLLDLHFIRISCYGVIVYRHTLGSVEVEPVWLKHRYTGTSHVDPASENAVYLHGIELNHNYNHTV